MCKYFHYLHFAVLLIAFVICTQSYVVFGEDCEPPDYFECKSGQCIRRNYVCNNVTDCDDNSDEDGDCDYLLCRAPGWFMCNDKKSCIKSTFRCDGERDCTNGEDEIYGCYTVVTVEPIPTCLPDQFQCSDKSCIPSDYFCDGSDNCKDGSDESPELCAKQNATCDGFLCDNKECIDSKWVCDGIKDCKDGSDEKRCVTSCYIEDGRFPCPNSTVCLDLAEVCDGKNDCGDNSDEGGACGQKNSCDSMTCSHGKCVLLPNGAECVCSDGFHFNQTSKSCEDIDECEIFGLCDQGCINSMGSYKCTCYKNFTLQDDMKTCKVKGGDPSLIFTDKKSIFGYKLHSYHEYLIAKNIKQGVGVCYDGDHVYWTQVGSKSESIVRARDDGSEKEVILTMGLEFPEDLAVDYLTGNIYFSDTSRKHIAVCSNNGYNCVVLVNDITNKPRAIVLYPAEGLMFWTDWGNPAYIGVSYMDGKDAKKLISEKLGWPNGLALDWPSGRIYWVDAKKAKIESARIDGTDRRTIMKSKLKHPYGLAVFENRIYWSDWDRKRVESADKFTGKNKTVIVNGRVVYDIAIYHPAIQPRKPHACIAQICSHLCMLSANNSYSCGCPPSMTLSSDQHECKDSKKSSRLMMGAGDYVINMPHETFGRHSGTLGERVDVSISKLEYNSRKGTHIFAADNHFKGIYAIEIATFDTSKVIEDNILDVSDIAYDYLANTLYWADAVKGTIEILSLNTNKRAIVRHFMGNDKPVAIALSSETGYMFVVQQSEEHAHIDKLPMNGGEPHVHLVEEYLGAGSFSLTVDEKNKTLYFADSHAGKIERVGFDGKSRETLYAKLRNPISIAIMDDEIYWIGTNSQSLYMGSQTNQAVKKKIQVDIPPAIWSPFDIHLVSVTPPKVQLHLCMKANGGCSHVCVSNGPTSRSCLCPPGMTFRANDTSICRESIRCEFRCDSGECIEESSKCDSKYDCSDMSDEKNCTTTHPMTCSVDQFQCQNGIECVPLTSKCDNHYDCSDKSDEIKEDCLTWNKTALCHNHQFKCSDGVCLDVTAYCDGNKDCSDGSDELNCDKTKCGKDKFRCQSGQCIFKGWECDGMYDCLDGSDEHNNCRSTDCPKNYFKCQSGPCINNHYVCDGNADCHDNSDELHCEKSFECPDYQAHCLTNSSMCIDKDLFCDGVPNCPNGEDESNCGDCDMHEFQCQNKHCIRREWVCDREDDCGDGSDESENCTNIISDPGSNPKDCTGKFLCRGGGCVEFSKVCDGKKDCFGGTDEGGQCDSACSGHPCQNKCVPTPQGPACSCNDGYTLDDDRKSCMDINECRTENPCPQMCKNTVGSYQCSCYSGYALSADKVSCKSIGPPATLLFTTYNQIRNISHYPLIIDFVWESNDTKIKDFDVDIGRNLLYFIMEDSGSLFQMDLATRHISVAMDIGDPSVIALDWITGNLYFSDITQNTRPVIKICNMHHRHCVKIMQLEYRDDVQDIVVDPVNKWLFVTTIHYFIFNMPTSKIIKVRLDGSRPQPILTSVSHITSTSLDFDKKVIYFTDLKARTLQQISYDGTNPKILIEKSAAVFKPISLSVFENAAYILNRASSTAAHCKLYGKKECETFDLRVNGATNIFVVQESMQKMVRNSCEDVKCSVLCIPADVGGNCACQNGETVGVGETCHEMALHHIAPLAQKIVSENDSSGSSTTSKVLWSLFGLALIAGLAISAFYFYNKKYDGKGTFSVSMYFQNPTLRTDSESVKMQPPELKIGSQHNEIVHELPNKPEYESIYNYPMSMGMPQNYAIEEFSDEDDSPLEDAESCTDLKQRLII